MPTSQPRILAGADEEAHGRAERELARGLSFRSSKKERRRMIFFFASFFLYGRQKERRRRQRSLCFFHIDQCQTICYNNMIMLLLTAISAFIALAFPQAVFAIKVENPCPLSHILSCTDLPAAVVNIGNAAILSFGGFLIAMFVFYGINMLIATGDENAMTDARKSVAFAIFGAILVAGAGVISNSLTNSGNFGGNLIDANSISGPGGFLWKIIEFIMGLAGAALTVMITYQGFRLVLSSDESQSSAARKNFLEGLIRAAGLVLVVPLVEAFITSGTDTPIRAMA